MFALKIGFHYISDFQEFSIETTDDRWNAKTFEYIGDAMKEAIAINNILRKPIVKVRVLWDE